jgi:O-acetyl-ADP-ribose deacetylase (regulator of RNase III)
MIRIVEGNILDAPEKIIVQQVNLVGYMGAGLALQIRNKYPVVYEVYKQHYKESELGDVLFIDTGDGKIIANIFAQKNVGTDKQYTIYDALTDGLYNIMISAGEKGYKIAIPYKIGCGLAGGNWDIVYGILLGIFVNSSSATIYKWEGK